MTDASLAALPWLTALATGCATALLAWLALDAWRRVPREQTGQPAPLPLWWRLLWPLTAVLAWQARQWQSFQKRRRLLARLQGAGLAQLMQPHHVTGACQASALTLAMLGLAWWKLSGHMGGSRGALLSAMLGAGMGYLFPILWLRERLLGRRREILRGLPFVLDMTTLCVEGGLNLQGALEQAADKCPYPALRDELRQTLGEIRTGATRAQALRNLAQRVGEPAVSHWVSAIIQADVLGMSLGPILRAQSDQRRSERFLHAEKLALEAPVKMLVPMMLFIFPCTFVVIAFPIAMKLLDIVGS